MKLLKSAILLLLLSVLATSCQVKPTVVSETYPVLIRTDKESVQRILKGSYSLVDIRPPIEYNLKSHPGSVPFWWEDETFRRDDGSRYFDDAQKIAQRLALKGLTPKKPVVLLTKNSANSKAGKEEKIALCILRQFGFAEIYMVEIKDIRSLNFSAMSAVDEAPYWSSENTNLDACISAK